MARHVKTNYKKNTIQTNTPQMIPQAMTKKSMPNEIKTDSKVLWMIGPLLLILIIICIIIYLRKGGKIESQLLDGNYYF
jgi:hypothetical protein